jgi:elongation factor P--beta-lysine ligase
MAYADYGDVMALTEEMVAAAAAEVNGSTVIVYEGKEVELAPPWPRLNLRGSIQERSGIDIAAYPTADALRDVMVQKGHDPAPGTPRGKLVESLLAHYVEPTLIQPAFVCDYPRDISPLAKSSPDDPATVERFEAYAPMELCQCFHRAQRSRRSGNVFLSCAASTRLATMAPPARRRLLARDALRHASLRRLRHGSRPPDDAPHRPVHDPGGDPLPAPEGARLSLSISVASRPES